MADGLEPGRFVPADFHVKKCEADGSTGAGYDKHKLKQATTANRTLNGNIGDVNFPCVSKVVSQAVNTVSENSNSGPVSI